MTVAEVRLWGSTVGAVSIGGTDSVATFQYTPEFAASGFELAPLMMPNRRQPYSFPGLPIASFHGLPGLLADSLPDKFGNALINGWLASKGRSPSSFDPVERLCYAGDRAMGALEFVPVTGPRSAEGEDLHVGELVELASQALSRLSGWSDVLSDPDRANGVANLLRVGTSAGGARAKAVIAWNPTTYTVRSGQISAGDGYSYWLLKFDGVSANGDKELQDPQGFGATEYAYFLMATAAGIEMSECRLLAEQNRKHFMTKRFDRSDAGGKVHMQSLAAMAHLDFNQAGAHSYEQAFDVIRRLNLGMNAIEQQFRRMVFNVVARNQDDHVKNIAFLMDRNGAWRLSPAFDVTFSFNPEGDWTSRHQMTINGKSDGFTRADFRVVGQRCMMQRGRPDAILDEVLAAVQQWERFADEAAVPSTWQSEIGSHHRLNIPPV